jgi:hypothetical protein
MEEVLTDVWDLADPPKFDLESYIANYVGKLAPPTFTLDQFV